MRHTDTQDSLADGFESAPLPPMGADGAPALEPVRELPSDPPRLCAAGPCRNYHTFQIQLDAQNPMNVARDGRVFHTEQHHYCYPTVGVETNLGSLPVLTCNRWAPATGLLRTKRGVRRAFERELALWREAHQPLELDLAAEDIIVAIVARVGDLEHKAELTFPATTAIWEIAKRAQNLCELDPATDPSWVATDDSGAGYENRDATLAELGVDTSVTITFVFTTNPETKETV